MNATPLDWVFVITFVVAITIWIVVRPLEFSHKQIKNRFFQSVTIAICGIAAIIAGYAECWLVWQYHKLPPAAIMGAIFPTLMLAHIQQLGQVKIDWSDWRRDIKFKKETAERQQADLA